MEYNTASPIYLQVMDAIKRDIVTGRIKPGEKLPSVRSLAVEYTINPNTVSRVYQELENERVCFTRRGMGTFVTEDTDRIAQIKEDMAQNLVQEFLKGSHLLGLTSEEAMQLLTNYMDTENKDSRTPARTT